MKLVYLIDIDGTIVDDISNEDLQFWAARWEFDPSQPLPGSVEAVNKLYDEGNYICFFTARPRHLQNITEMKLQKLGIRYHKVIYDKPRLRGTDYQGYMMIDNCAVIKACRFEGSWEGFETRTAEITVLK